MWLWSKIGSGVKVITINLSNSIKDGNLVIKKSDLEKGE